jgi:hypothetical protein
VIIVFSEAEAEALRGRLPDAVVDALCYTTDAMAAGASMDPRDLLDDGGFEAVIESLDDLQNSFDCSCTSRMAEEMGEDGWEESGKFGPPSEIDMFEDVGLTCEGWISAFAIYNDNIGVNFHFPIGAPWYPKEHRDLLMSQLEGG